MENGRLIHKLAAKMKRLADENLINENVTVEQLRIMKMINENGGTVLQREIERTFDVRRSTVTSAMQVLEKKGLITRHSNPEDSRSKLVSLTEAGQEKNRRLINFIVQRDEQIFSVLDDEENEALHKILLKLTENL